MRSRISAAAISAALLCAGLPGGVRAADPATPEQAQALEGQLRDWLAATLGATVPLPARPVQITPEGDHYRVAVPSVGSGEANTATALARPMDKGVWAVDQIRLPSPLHVAVETVAAGTLTYDATIGDQNSHAVLDPTYASPTTLDTAMTDIRVRAEGRDLHQSQRIARSAATLSLRPAVAAGRVDMVSSSTAEGYESDSTLPEGHQLRIVADRMTADGRVDALARDRVGTVIQAAVRLLAGVTNAAGAASAQGSARRDGGPKGVAPGADGGPKSAPPPFDKADMHAFLVSLQDFASGLRVTEELSGLRISFDQFEGRLSRLRMGMAGEAPAGVLRARMEIGLEGLDVPAIPAGPFRDFLPSRVTLIPTLSGVGVDDLYRLALAATAPEGQGGPASSPDQVIPALFRHGGIVAGLESVVLQIGPTVFNATGQVTAASPAQVTGSADVTATQLDALLDRAKAAPELAQAMPLLVFAKGIARTNGTQSTWNVSWDGSKVLVNGVDVLAMLGGAGQNGGGRPGTAQRPSSQPRPNQPQRRQ